MSTLTLGRSNYHGAFGRGGAGRQRAGYDARYGRPVPPARPLAGLGLSPVAARRVDALRAELANTRGLLKTAKDSGNLAWIGRVGAEVERLQLEIAAIEMASPPPPPTSVASQFGASTFDQQMARQLTDPAKREQIRTVMQAQAAADRGDTASADRLLASEFGSGSVDAAGGVESFLARAVGAIADLGKAAAPVVGSVLDKRRPADRQLMTDLETAQTRAGVGLGTVAAIAGVGLAVVTGVVLLTRGGRRGGRRRR